MLQDWLRMTEVGLTIEEWWRLPRNAAYKYEYVDGKAQITPRPLCVDVVLDLEGFRKGGDRVKELEVRQLRKGDWADLPKVMAGAFAHVAPFGTMTDAELEEAVADCLRVTREGGDGELLRGACVVGCDRHCPIAGAALVTLRHGETTRRAKTPLLTWIFVNPWMKRRGVGEAMLADVVQRLREMGHGQMESVVCTGNSSSMAWHWREGFVLSPRRNWHI